MGLHDFEIYHARSMRINVHRVYIRARDILEEIKKGIVGSRGKSPNTKYRFRDSHELIEVGIT